MKAFLSLLAGCCFAAAATAQWTSDTGLNTLVSNAVTGDMQSVGTSDGRTYVAFWHDVPAPKYYEMRLQLLDQNGNALFGPDGMVVDSTVAMSSFTTLWSLAIDADNNLYIGFNGTDGGNPAIVHKISPAGVQLWGNTGVALGTGFDVKVLPLPGGEVIACWLPGNKAVMQKISAGGALQWAAPVTIEPTVSNHKTSAGELAALSNGDYVVIIHDRSGFSPSALPFAQRYNSSGAAVWPAPVALSSNYYTAFNRRYPLIQDGDVLYFGYSGAQGIQPHGFVQRINPDGALPWGINGADFSTQNALYEQDVQIAYSPGSDVIWGLCTYSSTSQGEVGEFIQKFDKDTGTRGLTDLGKEIYPISADYISHQHGLQLVNDQPVFLVSNGNSNGVFAKDLLAVYLDKNGDFVWPGHTVPVATNATGVKSRIQLNRPFNGSITCAWAENRNNSGSSKPYAQQLNIAPASASSEPELPFPCSVSPNPGSGACVLEIDLPVSAEIRCRLYHLNGQLIADRFLDLPAGKQRITVQDLLRPGAYLLQVEAAGQMKVLPVLMQ